MIARRGCIVVFLGDYRQEIISTASWQLSNKTEFVEDASFTDTISAEDTSNMSTVTDTVTVPTCKVSQYFNAVSFIGGVVFVFGSVAILCFSRLFFHVNREHNYHTL